MTERLTDEEIAQILAGTSSAFPFIDACDAIRQLQADLASKHDLLTRISVRSADLEDSETRLEADNAALRADVERMRGALGKHTAGGERHAFSRVGHNIQESSWHIHLAGFRSQDDALVALAELLTIEAVKAPSAALGAS